jgi:TRAP-type C4-dicarboxylate transport system permease small subunit
LKKGEHIRVTLLIASLGPAWKRGFEIWSLFAASGLALLAAFYSGKLAWQSYSFHDISTSNDATPLWLPQLSMALGTAVLAVAFIDEFVLELRGQRASVTPAEAAHHE